MLASMPCSSLNVLPYAALTSSIAVRCSAASAIDIPPAIFSP